ncbi:hypothetical protein C1646_774911 [Rhizophagus diaphanus]|nr:hypothetical protein C1646_774911 [Rhizophagus diaphanus] [Rhizophagus sp. MUCL 43196]
MLNLATTFFVFIAGVSKRKKHINKLAEKKCNKHIKISETNINAEVNNEKSLWENVRDVDSDNEIIWEDDDLNNNQENFFQILMTQMQNYISPTRKSTYTENSARTKRRHHTQAKKDAEKNKESDDDDDLIYDSHQVINSLEVQLKEKNLDEGYKLRLTAILQKRPWFAQCLRLWSHMLQNEETIPFSKRNKYCKKKIEFYIADFVDYITNTIFSSLEIEIKTTISETTARIWLKKMGYHYKKYQKGVYVDGHEHEDVVEYQKIFLKKREMQVITWKFKLILICNWMNEFTFLLPIMKLHFILMTEEILNGFLVMNSLCEKRARTEGCVIYISDFICKIIGQLQLNEEQKLSEAEVSILHEARIIMNPGKNNNGWWTVEKLVEQIIQCAIPIFEVTHPNAIGIFAFDNSTSHSAFAPDALVASRMNVNPGGKQPKMRNTIFNGQVQYINFPDDYLDSALWEKPKGMKQILEERQLIRPDLIGYCQNNESQRMIQEVIEERGHKVIFYPKFHSELNFIKMYWGTSKKYSRKNCDYTWSGLQRVMLIALDHVLLSHIRAFAKKSYRYMDAY